MFNFKKVLGVVKRSICAALSAVMVLNMFSACADTGKPLSEMLPNFKILLLGEGGSGKTSLTNVLIGKKFIEGCLATIGLNTLSIPMGNRVVYIWDAACRERYMTISDSCFENSDLLVLTVPCDKDDLELSAYFDEWLLNNRYKRGVIDNVQKIKIVITKKDINPNSKLKEKIESFLPEYIKKNPGLNGKIDKEIIETSAKDGEGIYKLEDYISGLYDGEETENYEVPIYDCSPEAYVATPEASSTPEPDPLEATDSTPDVGMPHDVIDGLPETEISVPEDGVASASPQSNNKKWLIGGGIGAGALLIPAAAILIHKFCHKTPAQKKFA